MNILRADIYRILRGKGLYISLAVLIVVIALVSLTGGYVGVSYNASDSQEEMAGAMEAVGAERPSDETGDASRAPTGAKALGKAASSSNNVLFFLLPLVAFISVADFTSGGAKNTLACGVNRAKYFFAKLTLSFVLCALFLLVYILLSVLLASAFNGFGGALDGAFAALFAKILLSQFWLCLASACVANFFAFLFRSHVFEGAYIAFLLLPPLLIMTLAFINEWFVKLIDYDLGMIIVSMAQIGAMSSGEIVRAILVGAGYMAAAVAGGLALFNKAEIA